MPLQYTIFGEKNYVLERQTDRQTTIKQHAPNLSARGHKNLFVGYTKSEESFQPYSIYF